MLVTTVRPAKTDQLIEMPHENRLAWTQATLWLLLDEAYIGVTWQ